jgi:hypothetical protein
MRRKLYCLFLLLLGLPDLAVATREICGEPPPPQFKEENNESIKGDLEGKANFQIPSDLVVESQAVDITELF